MENQKIIYKWHPVKSNDNSLVATNPKLAAEWHPIKNGDLKPYDVAAGSGKKAWWLCECGHEWRAVISSRNSGRGCPICNESYLESCTRRFLQKRGFLFKQQLRFDNLRGYGDKPLSYDFGVFANHMIVKFLIECQGRQHYKSIDHFGGEEQFAKQQLHDELKREYAKEHSIKLIEVPYTLCTYRKVENFLIRELDIK